MVRYPVDKKKGRSLMGVVIKANFNLHPSVHCPPNTRIPENAFAEDDPFGPDYNIWTTGIYPTALSYPTSGRLL